MTDTLETLLNLVTETVGYGDVAIGNGGRTDPANPNDEWYCLAYWRDARTIENPDAEGWEINAFGPTLRSVLCAVIADERFGQ